MLKINTAVFTGKLSEDRWSHTYRFTQFTFDDGFKIYEKGNLRYASANEGNADFAGIILDAKIKNDYKVTYEERIIDDKEYIKNLEDSMDDNVEYIDDYNQYREACARNSRIGNRIREFEALFEEHSVKDSERNDAL